MENGLNFIKLNFNLMQRTSVPFSILNSPFDMHLPYNKKIVGGMSYDNFAWAKWSRIPIK